MKRHIRNVQKNSARKGTLAFIFRNLDIATTFTIFIFRGASGYKIDALTNKLKGALFRYPEVTSMLASLGIVIE